MTRGVIYLVWGSRAKARMIQSKESLLKSNPDLPWTCLELPDRATLLDKPEMFAASPFDNTLFLDADTTVLGNLDYGFAKSEQFGLACCICEVPWARRWGCFEGDAVEYNSGVLFFTRQHANLFKTWKRLCGDTTGVPFHSDKGPVEPHQNDQPLFSKAIELEGANPFVLPLNWNLRPHYQKSIRGPVVIWHDWTLPTTDVVKWSEQQAATRIIKNAKLAE